MKKISTLFKKDPNNLGRVINEINPENQWVFDGHGIPTRKYDGTACAIINGELYKRYDSKINKKTGKRKPVPEGAIPCQEPDPITGHHPHWVKCDREKSEDKYHFEAFDKLIYDDLDLHDGTFELIGEKINGNPEKIVGHVLIDHTDDELPLRDYSFESIRKFLEENDIEGIVFHHVANELEITHPDFHKNKMCKIRKSDFGIKRQL